MRLSTDYADYALSLNFNNNNAFKLLGLNLKPIFQTLLILSLMIVGIHLTKANEQNLKPVFVIANSSVEQTQISSINLSRIYAMQVRAWGNGQPAKVFTFSPQTQIYKSFVLSKVKLQPHQLDRHWKRLLFTGMGRTPQIVDSQAMMLEKIRTTPGAIGYVYEKPNMDGVKTLGVLVQ